MACCYEVSRGGSIARTTTACNSRHRGGSEWLISATSCLRSIPRDLVGSEGSSEVTLDPRIQVNYAGSVADCIILVLHVTVFKLIFTLFFPSSSHVMENQNKIQVCLLAVIDDINFFEYIR